MAAEYDEATLDAGRLAAVSERQARVQELIDARDGGGAVKAALLNPPTGTKDLSIKAKNAEVVAAALAAVKDGDIEGVVDSLTADEADVAMKYVYKGLEDGKNSGSLFKWHAQLVARHGKATIVRTLADRKTV